MGTFLADGSAVLPGVKQNATPPTGAPTEWAATDLNLHRDALLDLRANAKAAPNPMHFNAAGDGISDDHAAVQSCVDYCLSFSPPKAMVVTDRHRLASSVNIDRLVNSSIPDATQFHVCGGGDRAGFYTTGDANLFSSTIAPIGTQPMSERITFSKIMLAADSTARAARVLDERFIRVTFLACTFNKIRAYAHATCFAEEMVFDHCVISDWPGMFAASQGSYACQFTKNHALLGNTLVSSEGGVASTNGLLIEGNWIEVLSSSIARLSGTYGCSVAFNHIEYVNAPNAFHLDGALQNAQISFVGNYVILYASPFVLCGTTVKLNSMGNNIAVTPATIGQDGPRYLYGNSAAVTDLVSIGDWSTASQGGIGSPALISDSAHIATLNGISRHGNAAGLWTDDDGHFAKDAGGAFGFGRAPVSVVRAAFAGVDQSASNYMAAFYDSAGNPALMLRNDRRVIMPALPNYASNAAAVADGLSVGDLYKTAGAVMVVV
jgi:hypothetical protein